MSMSQSFKISIAYGGYDPWVRVKHQGSEPNLFMNGAGISFSIHSIAPVVLLAVPAPVCKSRVRVCS